MFNQVFKNSNETQSSNDAKGAIPAGATVHSPKIEDLQETELHQICREVADQFVRSEGKYFHVNHTGTKLGREDAECLARKHIYRKYGRDKYTAATIKKGVQRAFSGDDDYEDPTQSVALWDRRTRCAPGIPNRVIHGPDMASINTWSRPEFRSLGVTEADMSMLNEYLDWTFLYPSDRVAFLDWLSWVLKNEEQKPGWAPLLFSRRKGTGKSSLCQLVRLLFGEENTFTTNGVDSITGRFSKPLLDSKLLVLEELKLKPGTNSGNTLKTYITEESTSSERKGVDIEKTTQCCAFMFTTNHLPQWIEGGERRFLVIEMDHDGYAHGPKADEFREFMVRFHDWMQNPQNIAKLYNALMQRQQSNSFNPKSLDTSKIDTPVMRQIQSTSQEVTVQQLEEVLAEDGRGAIPLTDLVNLVSRKVSVNPNRLNHLMPELGWRHERIKWGKKDYARAIWIKQGYTVHRGKVTGPDGCSHPIDDQPGFSVIETIPSHGNQTGPSVEVGELPF